MEKLTKNEIQRQALEIYVNQKSRKGTICMSTGTGKSKVAIDFIKENKQINHILITSPRTNLKENWRKELIKWNLEEWRDNIWTINGRSLNITIENVQTAYKWKNKYFDLIIADEIHTMVTPEYSNIFKLKTTWLMGLTATHDITRKNDKQWYYEKYCPVIYEYYESADDGLINKTRFFIVDHELTNQDRVLVKYSKTQFWKGELEHYQYLTERIKKGQQRMLAVGSKDWFTDAADWFWKGKGDKDQKFAAMMYLNSIKYRKEFLQNLGSTAKLARIIMQGILSADQEAKILVFSELTAQIEKITKTTVHSHNNEILNSKRINEFNSGKIRNLGSCQSLTLGLNLKGATHGIMESYVGSATRSKQKKGRLDRLATDEIADMWFIRVIETQSEKWFEEMTKGFDLSDAIYVNSKTILNDEFDYRTFSIKQNTRTT